jgi:hypothetical protein
MVFGVAAYLGGVVAVGSLIEARSPTPSAPSPAVRRSETPEGMPHYMADPRGAAERVKQLARRTNGNWDGLTKAEQNWINAMTAGYGHELLWNQCRLFGIKPEGPPPPDRGRRAARSSSAAAQESAPTSHP